MTTDKNAQVALNILKNYNQDHSERLIGITQALDEINLERAIIARTQERDEAIAEIDRLKEQLDHRNTGDSNTGNWNTGNRNTGDSNTGYSNTGYRNTGNGSTGDRNTGDRNTGDRNTGDRNTGNSNTGNSNTGYWNTGYWNTGYWNTGYSNTGYRNTGNWNTGDRNTGDSNTGNWNTGDWNTGDCNTGFFNTTDQPVSLFNGRAMLKRAEVIHHPGYKALLSVPLELTKWVCNADLPQAERTGDDTEGKTIPVDWKEAHKVWWSKMTPENRKLVETLPGFDWAIFTEITGIERGKDE